MPGLTIFVPKLHFFNFLSICRTAIRHIVQHIQNKSKRVELGPYNCTKRGPFRSRFASLRCASATCITNLTVFVHSVSVVCNGVLTLVSIHCNARNARLLCTFWRNWPQAKNICKQVCNKCNKNFKRKKRTLKCNWRSWRKQRKGQNASIKAMTISA